MAGRPNAVLSLARQRRPGRYVSGQRGPPEPHVLVVTTVGRSRHGVSMLAISSDREGKTERVASWSLTAEFTCPKAKQCCRHVSGSDPSGSPGCVPMSFAQDPEGSSTSKLREGAMSEAGGPSELPSWRQALGIHHRV